MVSMAAAEASDITQLFEGLETADSLAGLKLFGRPALDAALKRLNAATRGKKTAVRLSFGLLFPQRSLESFLSSLDGAVAQGLWSSLLLESRSRLIGGPRNLEAALELARETLLDATGQPPAMLDVFEAFARPAQPSHRLVIELRNPSEIRVGNVRRGMRAGSSQLRGASQLKKMLVAYQKLSVFSARLLGLPAELDRTSAEIARASSDADRVQALENGLRRMVDVQSAANKDLGWTLDGSDAAFPNETIAPDTAALFALVARLLDPDDFQPPSETLQLWTAPKADSLEGVVWEPVATR
jgi:hypothetical protein